MSNEQANPSSVILSFLIGGLAGAALAVLFAPRAGKETRDMLGERIREGVVFERRTVILVQVLHE